MDIAAATEDGKRITHARYVGYNEKESTRLCNVFHWVATNFEKEINLKEAATVAGMNVNAFSRFFFAYPQNFYRLHTGIEVAESCPYAD